MRRRSLPYLVLGLVLALACAIGFVVTVQRIDGRTPVLVLARAVPAGHVLTAGDLRVERVAAGSGVPHLPAAEARTVIGRPVAVPLASGSLLAPSVLGQAAFPPTGLAVIAVAVRAGQYPLELTPGDRVAVVTGAGKASTATDPPTSNDSSLQEQPTATVLSVQPSADGQPGTAVASLLVSESAVGQIGAVPSDAVVLVQLSAGGA